MVVFQNARSEGNKVIEASIVMMTVLEAATPRPLKKPKPKNSMPSRATQTVAPAKITARPEVLSEVTMASSTLMPCCRFWRARVTMKRA